MTKPSLLLPDSTVFVGSEKRKEREIDCFYCQPSSNQNPNKGSVYLVKDQELFKGYLFYKLFFLFFCHISSKIVINLVILVHCHKNVRHFTSE
jgi:hypothetical protein